MDSSLILLLSAFAAVVMRGGYLLKFKPGVSRSEALGGLILIAACGFMACSLLQWKTEALPWHVYVSAALFVGFIGEKSFFALLRRYSGKSADLAPAFER